MRSIAAVIGKCFRIRTLKNKLVLSYILILSIAVLFTGLSSYEKAASSLEDEIKRYIARAVVQISNGVDTQVREMNRMALIINSDDEIVSILSGPGDTSEADEIERYLKVQSIIQNTVGFRPEIVGFNIFAIDGSDYSMSSSSLKLGFDYKKQEWFKELQEKGSHFTGVHYQEQVIDSNAQRVITLAKVLKDPYSYNTIGYVLIDCSIRAFDSIFAEGRGNSRQNSSTFIVDEEGELIYSSKHLVCSFDEIKGFLGSFENSTEVNFINTRTLRDHILISYYTSPYTGWRTINVIPVNEISKNIKDIGSFTFIIIILSAIVTFIISYLIALSITKPVKKLKEKMKIIQQGNFNITSGIESDDEIGELGKSFDTMIHKINEMVNKVYETELAKREAEINALQAQINPHFLYNTLAAIDSLATIKNAHDISEMCRALAKIFRYNIETGEESNIGREMEKVRLYLLIEKKRFGDRFDFNIDMQKGLEDCRILKLLIQPLVENAIVHGLEGKRGKVYIEISVKKDVPGKVIVTVSDTGKGISPEKLDGIRNSLSVSRELYWQNEQKGRLHIGLKNINYRIKLNYGDDYGLTIISEVDKGTSTSITIPEIWTEEA